MPPAGDLQLSIGYWLVSHRATLRTWWAVSLLTFILISVVWGLAFTVIFFSQSRSIDTRLSFEASQSAAGVTMRPIDPSVSKVTVVDRDDSHVDIVATVTNPNADWGAESAQVHFALGSQAIPTQTVFLNPRQDRPVMALNVAVTPRAQLEPSIRVDGVNWVKSANAALPAANFVVESVDLTPTTVTIAGQSIVTINLRANLTNRSVYNYRHVIIPIVIKQGETIVAVDQVTADAWATLTTRTITDTWPYAIGGQVTAELTPQVSRFDQTNIYR